MIPDSQAYAGFRDHSPVMLIAAAVVLLGASRGGFGLLSPLDVRQSIRKLFERPSSSEQERPLSAFR
jgi:hypothetical protein